MVVAFTLQRKNIFPVADSDLVAIFVNLILMGCLKDFAVVPQCMPYDVAPLWIKAISLNAINVSSVRIVHEIWHSLCIKTACSVLPLHRERKMARIVARTAWH